LKKGELKKRKGRKKKEKLFRLILFIVYNCIGIHVYILHPFFLLFKWF